MSSSQRARRRLAACTAAAVLAVSALTLSGCGASGATDGGGTGDRALVVGTTDRITSIDPAGSFDNGSGDVMNQVYAFLMNSPYGSSEVEPDIAETAAFTSPTEYTVTLKPGLTFANGHDLTSSDVKFSFDRQLTIDDDNGPATLLANLDSVTAPDASTVVFRLKVPNDQTFPYVLSSPAGPIVDEEVFSADEVTADKAIVDAHAFAGPYDIVSYDVNNLIAYRANPGYQGLLGAPATDRVTVKYYAESSNLKLDIQKNTIDVAWRSLSATDIASLRKSGDVEVVTGPGGETRYITFNFDTQPYGAKTGDADAKKALAVRQAAAHLVDRTALAEQVYKGTYTPLYSFVPDGLVGATTVLKDLYGDGEGGPSSAQAKQVLRAAGVSIPVALNLQYNPEHYGPSSADEYALVKDQLESDGLFTVNLQSTEWVQYWKDRAADVYPAYQLGWFPDFSDADNYLSPFFIKENFLANHYDDAEVQELIAKQAGTTDKGERIALIEQIQAKVAADLSTLPLLQGAQVAVVAKGVSGAEKTLDPSFKFRFGALAK